MEDLTEKEQLEKFREWWKEFGNFVIGGIVLGIAIMVGIHQWKSRTIENQIAASAQFEALMNDVEDGDLEAAESVAGAMYDDHGSSIYAAQTRLAMARLYMDKGRDEDAAETLRGMLDSNEDSEIQRVGRLRLAKVLLYQNKPADIIELLQGITDSEFLPRYSELLGDAYRHFGNVPTLLERDFNFPPIEELVAEIRHIQSLQAKLGERPSEIANG